MAVLLTACGASSALAPDATNTPEPVTFSTPTLIPTLTPAPARSTTILPASTPSSIVSAMTRTKSATRYRVTMTLNVRQGTATQFSLDLKGDVNGDDEHDNYSLGNEQIEFVETRGQYFVKGARSLGLPSATKWYVLSADTADAARPPFSAEDVLTSFIAQAPKENFQPAARESLDGVSCQIYRYAPKNLMETGIANLVGSEQEASTFGALDVSEIKLWICEDGMMHQLTVDVNAHNPRRTTDKGTAQLKLHVWDFANNAIKIDPPPNAEKFQSASPTP